jgi:hypothetical protein
MPLPDADDAKKSNLYAQLRSSQLDSVSQDNFDKVKDPVFINAAFEDEARRLMLWGVLSGKVSTSGPIPGTGRVITVTTAAGGGYPVDTLLEPGPGEAYEVSFGNWSEKNAGAMYLRMYDADGTYSYLEYKTAGGIWETANTAHLIVCYPQILKVYYGSATDDNSTTFGYCRVR